MNFIKRMIGMIVCALVFSACTACGDSDLAAEERFLEDLDSITADIRVMYDEVDADYLYEPFLHIAFADINFDGIPEFFYGYQTITGSHNKIWFRAYSLRDRDMIGSEHSSDWGTYIEGDKECVFFTGPKNFLEGYYLNDNAEPCFVTKAHAGPVTNPRTDFVFIEHRDSKLFITESLECDKELQEIKQIWSLTEIDRIKDDIIELLKSYGDFSDERIKMSKEARF